MNLIRNAAFGLAISSLALAGCGSGGEQADPAPEAAPGLSADNARVVLPAVSGRPAAAYFDLSNDGDRRMIVRAADVAGAGSTMMHETDVWDGQARMREATQYVVEPGETISLEPGGAHLMAMEPSDTLQAGGSTEITVTVVGGDKISFPAEVRAAGDDR